MKLLRIAFRKETLAPMLALVFGSGMSVALVLGRMIWTDTGHHAFLIWNLFLAWLPLVFALWTSHEERNPERRPWRLLGLAGAWLLFFPNSSYIFTDLIHLTTRFYRHFWVDLVLILLCALTGLLLGFLSLYIMQSVVIRRFGRLAGWLFVAVAAGLSGFGVYLGRFLRFNSWDVIVRPGRVFRGLDNWWDGPMLNQSSAAFIGLFAIFLFIAYLMLYALTHLGPRQELAPVMSNADPLKA